jgi:hypothetical protein
LPEAVVTQVRNMLALVVVSSVMAVSVAEPALPVAEPDEPVTEPAIALVTVRSVKKPAVSLAPVAPREPVEVMLFVPIARLPLIVNELKLADDAKRLVDEAVVLKMFVVVALVIVELVDAKVVEVAAVEVERLILKNAKVVEAVHTFPWPRLTPMVLAVDPL